jgi:hypothetical protein
MTAVFLRNLLALSEGQLLYKSEASGLSEFLFIAILKSIYGVLCPVLSVLSKLLLLDL